MTRGAFEVSERELREGLPDCLAVPRWVDEVAAGGPYASLDDLLDAAGLAATPLSAEEVDQALADHPRIGERPTGSGAGAGFSAAEQESSASDDADLAAQLAEGNRAYEEKFGRIFLIRAAGRSPPGDPGRAAASAAAAARGRGQGGGQRAAGHRPAPGSADVRSLGLVRGVRGVVPPQR